jgi:hypothetical protein
MHAAAIVGGKVVRFRLSPALARAHRQNRGKAMTVLATAAMRATGGACLGAASIVLGLFIKARMESNSSGASLAKTRGLSDYPLTSLLGGIPSGCSPFSPSSYRLGMLGVVAVRIKTQPSLEARPADQVTLGRALDDVDDALMNVVELPEHLGE